MPYDLNSIFVFDVPDFNTPAEVIPQNTAYNLSFSQDSKLLIYQASPISDPSLHIFDLMSRREAYSIKLGVYSYQISPNGNLLTVQYDDSISLLDIHTGIQKVALVGNFLSFSFRSDSSEIATIESDEQGGFNMVWIWDAITGQRLKRLDDWTASPTNIVFSSRDNLLAVQYQDNGMIALWDSSINRRISSFDAPYDDTGLGLKLLFSSDTKYLASFGSGKIYLWQLLHNNNMLVNISGIDPNSYGGEFNKDNDLLVYWDFNELGLPSADNQTRLWSISEGQNIITLPDARDPQFSPDGTMLASWGDSVQIWAVQ